MKANAKRMIWCAFGAYIALMLWLLFGQRMGVQGSGSYAAQLLDHLNLVPLRTIGQYLGLTEHAEPVSRSHAIINLAGNVVMFVPLGFFLPLVASSCRKYRNHSLWVLAILLAIELLQLFTLLGSFDVDDFILNLAGAAIGYGFYRLVETVKTVRTL